jgi:hypothetical protein
MIRHLVSPALGVIAAYSLLAGPAIAADYPELRPAYEPGWETGESSIRFEAGTRYWMSWGRQDATFDTPIGDVSIDVDDQTHIGEIHGRIDDLYTNTYLKAQAGLGLHTSGTYDISPSAAGAIGSRSTIGYVGADYGWMPVGQLDEGFALGAFAGYAYWKDAPDIGQGRIVTGFDGFGNPNAFAEAKDDFDVHALRLGVRATAEFDMFDLQGEVAYVPYAHVTGVLGGTGDVGFATPLGPVYESAPTTLSGRGHGVMAEGMLGFRPTENLALRIGGRAWYVEGDLEATMNVHGAPAMTVQSTMASVFRYGALFELTGRF